MWTDRLRCQVQRICHQAGEYARRPRLCAVHQEVYQADECQWQWCDGLSHVSNPQEPSGAHCIVYPANCPILNYNWKLVSPLCEHRVVSQHCNCFSIAVFALPCPIFCIAASLSPVVACRVRVKLAFSCGEQTWLLNMIPHGNWRIVLLSEFRCTIADESRSFCLPSGISGQCVTLCMLRAAIYHILHR